MSMYCRYQAFLSLPSYCGTSHSEDNLDEDANGPSKRKSKKKHVRRRSGNIALSPVFKSNIILCRFSVPSVVSDG